MWPAISSNAVIVVDFIIITFCYRFKLCAKKDIKVITISVEYACDEI